MRIAELLVGDVRLAVELGRVLEVAPRVELTPLPGAPPVVAGVCRYRGELAVAIDMRARLGFAARAGLEDHLLIARTPRRLVALIVDRVVDLREIDERAVATPTLGLPAVNGLVQLDDGVLLLFDLDAALGLDEEAVVAHAVQALGSSG